MANNNTLQKQDGFKSQFGFIMAAVGSCVGMANVWRFPMLVSRYGGLTFLIPYFIFAFIICQSGMMEEFSLGRWAKSGPSGAFGKAMENGGHSKKLGEWIGGVPVLGSLLLAIGYSVVMGWVFAYTKMAITGELTAMGTDMDVIGGTFGAMAPEAQSLPEALQMTFGHRRRQQLLDHRRHRGLSGSSCWPACPTASRPPARSCCPSCMSSSSCWPS